MNCLEESGLDYGFECYKYIDKIKSKYNSLNPSEKSIADFILVQQDKILQCSVQEVAKLVYTSPASIVRFCNKIGFKGFAHLKFCIESQLEVGISGMDEICFDDSIVELKRKVLLFNKNIITDAVEGINDEKLEVAIDAIQACENLYIFSDIESNIISSMIFNAFLQIGLKCYHFNDSENHINISRHLTEKDVALFITQSSDSKNIFESIKISKKNSAFTIYFTGNKKSKINKYADITLFNPARSSLMSSDLPASIMSDTIVLTLLYVGVYLKFYKNFEDVDVVMSNVDVSEK